MHECQCGRGRNSIRRSSGTPANAKVNIAECAERELLRGFETEGGIERRFWKSDDDDGQRTEGEMRRESRQRRAINSIRLMQKPCAYLINPEKPELATSCFTPESAVFSPIRYRTPFHTLGMTCVTPPSPGSGFAVNFNSSWMLE